MDNEQKPKQKYIIELERSDVLEISMALSWALGIVSENIFKDMTACDNVQILTQHLANLSTHLWKIREEQD